MAGGARTGRLRGSSQGQNPKTRGIQSESINERQEEEGGRGHLKAPIPLITALVHVCRVSEYES